MPPALNCSRPPPDPTGSYEIVRSGFWSWTPAIHASWAASWALEPAPAISPETASPPLLLVVLSLEPLSPQAATPRASTELAPAASSHFFEFT